jgi:two-component system, OmpR family, response regulator
MRLLVVEDEPDLRRSLVRSLSDAQFAVDEAADGEDGLFRALEVEYDAIVLDLMLPGRSGDAVLEAIRRAGRTTPVLLLTARDTIADRVRGLNHGADDYLTKPFVLDELIARLRALIRRAQQQPAPAITIGELRIDLVRRRVYRDEAEVGLTGREFGILEQLVRHRGRILTRTALSEHLYSDSSEVMSNAIDVHVAALRRKLGPALIETRRGQGYLIDA